jgi:hypothetical protein
MRLRHHRGFIEVVMQKYESSLHSVVRGETTNNEAKASQRLYRGGYAEQEQLMLCRNMSLLFTL